MSTGENEQALRKIIDMTRWIAIIILVLHFYYYLYNWFGALGLAWSFVDKILFMSIIFLSACSFSPVDIIFLY